jgi:hypothetical protein
MKIPALLSFNPELQRGLWLELTPSRLIATPIVVVLILAGAYAEITPSVAITIATSVIWLLLVLWGSRLAAESVGDEITGRTWDVQRLSAQSPWGLTLGKLCGGTAFAWYGAAICGLALILMQAPNSGRILLDSIIGGLAAQSIAFFIMLVLHRFDPQSRRAHTTFAQIAAIILSWKSGAFPSLPITYSTTARVYGPATPDSIGWYGWDFDPTQFSAVLQFVAVGWLIFGAMRLIRRELGFVDGPLGWTFFSVYAVAVVAGFVPRDALQYATAQSQFARPLIGFQSLVWLAPEVLTYIALFGTPVSRIGLLKLSGAFGARDWRGVWRNLPMWVPSAILAALAGLMPTIRVTAWLLGDKSGDAPDNILAPIPFVVLGFLLRDVALVYLLRLAYRRRTAAALLIMFVILYVAPVPLLSHLAHGVLIPFFLPRPQPTIIGMIAPWIEAAVAWFAVWRLLHRPSAVQAG